MKGAMLDGFRLCELKSTAQVAVQGFCLEVLHPTAPLSQAASSSCFNDMGPSISVPPLQKNHR